MHEPLKKRGISEKVYKHFKLEYENKKLYIPVLDLDGKFLFNKIRHDDGANKYTYSKIGSTAQLFCGHLIKNKKKVIITEGELDALVMWSHKIPAVSTTSGAISGYKDEWIAILKDKDKEVYICYDNDPAGRKGAAKLKQQLPNATVLFINDVKDISEYYEKHGEVDSLFNLTKSYEETPNNIKQHQTTPNNTTDDRVQRAKDIPITNFQKFNRENKINCIFHDDKTPSLAYDKKTNTFKCFGCGEFGDSISFYMKLHSVDFQTALTKLVGSPTIKRLNAELEKMGIPTTDTDTGKSTKEIEFLMTDQRTPQVRCIGANIKLIFDNDKRFHNKFRYDSFRGKFETKFGGYKKWMPLEDDIIQSIINEIQIVYPHFDSGMNTTIRNQVVIAARKNSISPPLEYIKSIKWDKVPRLNKWIHKTYYTEDIDYYSEIGRRWITGMVKRLAYPGCQFDNVLVIEGPQNFGKSKILRELCTIKGEGMFFDETAETPDNSKEFALTLLGNMVVEFAEGAIAGYKNQQKVKSFITKVDDNYRPPFTRNTDRHPRQCVFAMTTNDSDYLKDKTGERRYWPVVIPEDVEFGNWDWIIENKDQMFAEAYTHINDKYEQFPDDVQEYFDILIEGRKEIDPLEDLIVDWFNGLSIKTKEEGLAVQDGKDQVDNPDMRSKYLDREISQIYKHSLRLQQIRPRLDSGTRPRLYTPTKKTPMVDGDEELSTLEF